MASYSEVAPNGGYSQFINSTYRANEGGKGAANQSSGGNGVLEEIQVATVDVAKEEMIQIRLGGF